MTTNRDNTPTNERSPYARPELRSYGAITNLVQGSSGTMGDGPGSMQPA